MTVVYTQETLDTFEKEVGKKIHISTIDNFRCSGEIISFDDESITLNVIEGIIRGEDVQILDSEIFILMEL